MFGAEQSGNMSQVGFDLFAAMLNEAIVKERTGDTSDDETISALSDIAINIAEDAYIPDDYIEDVGERVLFYRKISFATDHELVASAFSEMTEKYPEPPDAAINVFARADLRIFCSEHDISSISIAKGYLSVEPVEVSSEALSDLREFSALYSKTQKRLRVPIRNIRGDDNKFSLIHNFLKDYLDN